MIRFRSLLAIGLMLSMGNLAVAQAPAREDKSVAGPLEARLVAKKDTYMLAKGQQGEEFRKALTARDAVRVPDPPKVDLVLELKNPSESAVTIMVGSDAGGLDLELKGKGAVTVSPNIIMTREFRIGKEVKIEAGKTYEMPITQLKFGLRGVSQHAYWTEPGEHTLAATYRWPAKNAAGAELIMKAAAAPIKLTVKAAE